MFVILFMSKWIIGMKVQQMSPALFQPCLIFCTVKSELFAYVRKMEVRKEFVPLFGSVAIRRLEKVFIFKIF